MRPLSTAPAADENKEFDWKMFTKFQRRSVVVVKDGRIASVVAGSKEFEGVWKLHGVLFRTKCDNKFTANHGS